MFPEEGTLGLRSGSLPAPPPTQRCKPGRVGTLWDFLTPESPGPEAPPQTPPSVPHFQLAPGSCQCHWDMAWAPAKSATGKPALGGGDVATQPVRVEQSRPFMG